MIAAVDPADVEKTLEAIKAAGDAPYVVGRIEAEKKSRLMLKVVVLVSGV